VFAMLAKPKAPKLVAARGAGTLRTSSWTPGR